MALEREIAARRQLQTELAEEIRRLNDLPLARYVELADRATEVAQAVQTERERCVRIANGRIQDRIRDQYTGEITEYERQMTQSEIVEALRVEALRREP